MQKLKIILDKLWCLPSRRKAGIGLARIREHPLAEPEQEEHCLDAMRSWRDPIEQTRTLRHHAHTLVEDDPPSS
jgi:hypothetical protein